MKEKNKGVLKGLGVVALACLGMVTFTGCALNVNAADGLTAKFEAIQQSQQQTIEELQKQNNNLQDLLEEFKKLSKEEVFGLWQTAITNAQWQLDGYDNVALSAILPGQGTEDAMIYITPEKSMMMVKDGTSTKYKVSYYDAALNKLVFGDVNFDGQEYECVDKYISTSADVSKYNYADMSGLTNPLNVGGEEGFLDFACLNNFVKYELLDNGNYSLVFTCEKNGELADWEKEEYEITSDAQYTQHIYFEIEITKDAKVLNMKYKGVTKLHFTCEKEQEVLEDYFNGGVIEFSVAYSYGTVDAELMETLYETINESPEIDG